MLGVVSALGFGGGLLPFGSLHIHYVVEDGGKVRPMLLGITKPKREVLWRKRGNSTWMSVIEGEKGYAWKQRQLLEPRILSLLGFKPPTDLKALF